MEEENYFENFCCFAKCYVIADTAITFSRKQLHYCLGLIFWGNKYSNWYKMKMACMVHFCSLLLINKANK